MPRWARNEHNQSLFRHVNDEIATLARFQTGSEQQSFVCECHRLGCTAMIEMPIEAYEEVRDDPTAFLVLRGHEHPDDEIIANDHGMYLVVRTLNTSSDPRVSQRSAQPSAPAEAWPASSGQVDRDLSSSLLARSQSRRSS